MKVPTAIELFERRYIPYIEQVCRGEPRHGFSPDDVVQHVRVKLFVPQDGRPPKIFAYSGRGPLRSWLRSIASRALLDEYRRQKYLMKQLTDRFTALPDPEVAFLKEKYRHDFRDSFEYAVSTLTSRERNLLRLHVLGGLTLEQLAAFNRVNRTTIVRQLIKIRKTILSGTRRELVRKLGCQPDEVGSILRFIESRLEVSFSRILGPEEDE